MIISPLNGVRDVLIGCRVCIFLRRHASNRIQTHQSHLLWKHPQNSAQRSNFQKVRRRRVASAEYGASQNGIDGIVHCVRPVDFRNLPKHDALQMLICYALSPVLSDARQYLDFPKESAGKTSTKTSTNVDQTNATRRRCRRFLRPNVRQSEAALSLCGQCGFAWGMKKCAKPEAAGGRTILERPIRRRSTRPSARMSDFGMTSAAQMTSLASFLGKFGISAARFRKSDPCPRVPTSVADTHRKPSGGCIYFSSVASCDASPYIFARRRPT